MNKAPNIMEKATCMEKIFHKCLQIICSHFILIRGVKVFQEHFVRPASVMKLLFHTIITSHTQSRFYKAGEDIVVFSI